MHIIYLVIGGLCGMMMIAGNPAALELSGKDFIIHMAIALLMLFLAFFVQIIIHELGHLIFGLLTGYKFVSFRVGSFMFVKENGKLKVKIFSIMGTGGQCLMMPPPWTENFSHKLYNFGGCIFNFWTAILAFIIFIFYPGEDYLAIFLGMLGVVGLGNVFVNGIPMEANGISNDGRNTVLLDKNKTALRSFWLQLYVNGLLNQGERMKNLPAEWFFLPQGEDLKDPIICTVGVLKYNYEFDIHDFAAAEATVEYMLKAPGLLGLHKNELLCELLFLKIFRNAPKEEIEPLLTKELRHYIKATGTYLSRKRLDCAYALLYLKDINLTKKAFEEFEKRTSLYGSTAEVQSEKEIVELIKAKAEIY